jgi:hypothetical protein
MIINEKIIKDIFDLKLKLKNKDKIILSKYQELIPMYDIYSQTIYPINKKNLYYRLIESSYRFVNNEIIDWQEKQYKKYKDIDKVLSEKLKKNLMIMENYDIKTLIDTSYKTLYEFSKDLGLSISICKRNSFDPYIKNLKPYYTKLELIKLGQNMKIIKEISIEKLFIQEVHYDICKKVSKNDVSFEEIKNHTLHIINSNLISYITFYSFYGSFLYNKLLRGEKHINLFLVDGIKKINSLIKKSPKLNNNYYLYRFIWDDSFINNLQIGDIYSDKGFLSTTRDPFYNPGLNGNFGLILVKINVPKDIEGIGLFIENFSLFPKEEEFLLPPNCKMKLISRDNNFKYFHLNKIFEKLINKKYEFELINNSYINLTDYNVISNYKEIDLKTYETCGVDRINMFKNFIKESNEIKVMFNNKKYIFYCMFFDSLDSSYSRFYYNKIKDGLHISLFDNGYPYLNIECGNELIVNYVNQFYYYGEDKIELNSDHLDIILEFGRIFFYKEAKIFNNFRNFSKFKVIEKNKIFKYCNLYDHTIYDYAKNKNKYLNYPFIKSYLGWYKLDEILNKKIDSELSDLFKLNFSNNRELLIHIIENDFINYDKIIANLELKQNNYFIYQIYEKLNYQNRIVNFRSDINYDDKDNLGDDFKLIFRQPIRRY